MTDNYQNFIYLFNDKYELQVKSDNTFTSFEDAFALQAFAGVLKESLGGEVNYKLIGGDTKEFPPNKFEILRKDEDIRGASQAPAIGAGAPPDNNERLIFTNDHGNNPRDMHVFEVALNVEKNSGAKSYKFFRPTGLPSFAAQTWKFTAAGSVAFEVAPLDPFDLFSFGQQLPVLADMTKPTQEDANSYTYFQRILYKAAGYSGGISEPIKQSFSAYFDNLVGNVDDGSPPSFVPYSVIDVATKIGVPYDYQTVLTDKLDLKALGVHTKQPIYHKIYNYYDYQYESVVDNIIDGGFTDERALPSIYDFLYLPVQDSVAGFIKISSIPLEETNLAGINVYLDTFAKLYSKLDEQQVPNETIELIVNGQFIELGAKYNLDYNLSLKDLGWKNPNAPIIEPTKKQILLQGLDLIVKDKSELDNKKSKTNPVWINQLKTGVYFSKKSLNIFNQTLDYDDKFPFLMKIDIQTDNMGPLAKLFDQVDLLDAINAYAASVVTPDANGTTLYNNYYGAVINGVDATNFNTLFDFKLPTFKIFLKDRPTSPLTIEQVYDSAKAFGEGPVQQNPGGALGDVPFDADPNEVPGLPDLEDEPNSQIDDNEVWLSWKRKKIDHFVDTYKLSPDSKIIIKIHPYKKIIGGQTVLIKPPEYGPPVNILGEFKGPVLEVWAYDSDNILYGNSSMSWVWHELEYLTEKTAGEKETNGIVTFAPYIYKYTKLTSIYDVSDTDIDSKSIYAEKTYSNDLYIDTLIGNNLSNVFTYEEDGAGTLTKKSSIQSLLDKLKLSIFNKKLKELLLDESLLRTPQDIHDGKLAHQETLMYEIAKYGISDEGEYYIQSIFLPITEQSKLSYYDTQVIPYKDYFYKIFVHKAIVGTEYKLAKHNSEMPFKFYDLATNDIARLFVEFKYEIEPFIQIVRTPYYNTNAVNVRTDAVNYSRIEDKPPLPPQVNFIPYRNVDDDIMIFLNNSLGEIEQYPRPVFDDEWIFFDKAAIAQDRAPGDQLIFRSDDSLGKFQIFRTEKPHSTYQEFGSDSSLRFMEVENLGSYGRDSTALVDKIRPNQDYYYFVRFLDLHNKFSNPTVVYKMRMISQNGVIPYMHLEAIDLIELQKKQYEEKFSAVKNVQKYLLIQPSPAQNNMSTPSLSDNTGLIDKGWNSIPVNIGDENGDSVFGRKFKFRITSKQTGRKIDINLTVKDPENIINQ